MMYPVIIAVGAGLILWSISRRPSSGSPLPPVVSTDAYAAARTVSALGDSLTAHGGYCSSLEAQLPAGSSVTCHGYVGQGAKVIGTHLDEALADLPDDLVVLAGVNDLASGRDPRSSLDTIYRTADAAGARVIAVRLTPWAGHARGVSLQQKTLELNAWITQNQYVSAVVDTSALGDAAGNLLAAYGSGDGLHLNSEGQRKLGELIAEQAF